MREIKFRAWDKKKRTLHYFESNWYIVDYDEEGLRFPWAKPKMAEEGDKDSFILMQYTGLKDQNGKEIYEGDIINDIIRDEVIKLRVTWDDGQWWAIDFKDLDGEETAPLSFVCSNPIEYGIIGNIYENPELLKEK